MARRSGSSSVKHTLFLLPRRLSPSTLPAQPRSHREVQANAWGPKCALSGKVCEATQAPARTPSCMLIHKPHGVLHGCTSDHGKRQGKPIRVLHPPSCTPAGISTIKPGSEVDLGLEPGTRHGFFGRIGPDSRKDSCSSIQQVGSRL